MKIDINKSLTNIDDQPLLDNGKVVTLREVCVQAVLTPSQKDTQEEKWNKYDIYKKIKSSDAFVELTVEEISIIKKASGEIHPPLLMGQLFDLLENN